MVGHMLTKAAKVSIQRRALSGLTAMLMLLFGVQVKQEIWTSLPDNIIHLMLQVFTESGQFVQM